MQGGVFLSERQFLKSGDYVEIFTFTKPLVLQSAPGSEPKNITKYSQMPQKLEC